MILLIALSFHFYLQASRCREAALDLNNKLIQCKFGLDQSKDGLSACIAESVQCQEILLDLK